MLTKDKAKELVLKYEKLLFNRFTTEEDWVKCVECALIAVDEILTLNVFEDYSDWTYTIEYWEEVRQEIDKM
jgi:hypothetical protein